MNKLASRHTVARDLCEQDVEECFTANRSWIGEEIVGFAQAVSVWKRLIGNVAFVCKVFEVGDSQAGCPIAGFGARVLVSRKLVERETSSPRPGLVARLVASIAGGEPVILNCSEISRANSDRGVDIVVVTGWRPGMFSGVEEIEALTLSASCFFESVQGYFVNQMVMEVTSEAAKRRCVDSRAWRIISEFDEFHARHPNSGWGRPRALATITRDDALRIPGHRVNELFLRRQAQLSLGETDRRFLAVAVSGLTDSEIAGQLGITLSGVKKRWLSLFERIAATKPALLAGRPIGMESLTRGRQKRHLLLAYIRSHPEELIPFLPR